MSQIKMIQQIRELSKRLQQAYDDADYDLADDLEDQIAEIEDAMEEENELDYAEKHDRGWN